jgi:hypothetical protein
MLQTVLAGEANVSGTTKSQSSMEKVTVLNLRVGAWLPFGNSAANPSPSCHAPAAVESELSPVYYAPLVYYQPVDNVKESAKMPEYARVRVEFQ